MESLSKVTVLYHADCPDGFGAAWSAWTVLDPATDADVTYVPVRYGEPPPGVDGGSVFVLDFSYDRATLTRLSGCCDRLYVIDHHKTAAEALVGWDDCPANVEVRFDQSKSGAVLAWEFFHEGEPVPLLLRYVQDRDLWAWGLPDSRAFSEALSVTPGDFGAWSEVDVRVRHRAGFDAFVADGRAILKAKKAAVGRLCDNAYLAAVGDHGVMCVNSACYQSEVGEQLCLLYPDLPFAAVWHARDGVTEVWSLRSRNGFDVSAVAKSLGGGGHAAAAGFTVRR